MKRIVYIAAALSAVLFIKPAGSAGPPNVILLTVDTLRADRLSCYGYKYKTSPNIDRLVKKGTLFTNATTNVPLTSPSFCSLLTSQYPHQTGSIRNGIPMVDGIPTLATVFKQAGYHTAAILSNWPLKAHLSNLQAGFDIYDDDFHQKRWLFFNDERDAEGVTDRALEWLESGPQEPFFAWIHYSDPHAPYLRHKAFMFEDSNSDSARYDSEVAYTDYHMGRLIVRLEAAGLFDRSLVIFTSDHGESLGEHGYTGHGRKVYQPSMAVPLAVMGPGLPEGAEEDGEVQLLDLMPTALSYAGIEFKGDMLGMDLIPVIKNQAEAPARTLYYETYPGAAPSLQGAEDVLKRPIWIGTRTGSMKLMYSPRFRTWGKYDIQADPEEMNNLVDLRDPDFMSESDELMSWYRGWKEDMVVGQVGAMTEKDREKFKALGYIEP